MRRANRLELWIAAQRDVPGNIRGSRIHRRGRGVVARWELCAFNNLAAYKYRRLGLRWEFEGVPLLSKAELQRFEEVARSSGVDPEIVLATGRTRIERAEVASQADRSPVAEMRDG
jgi:hypothetical protein